ncbi:putative phosphoserine phosphatase 2 [compost metagenome]
MRQIYVIQHCQSEHHVNNMTGGWTDTPLTELGKRQAEAVGIRLQKNLDPNEYSLYASDLMRASQTASIIGEQLNIQVKKNNSLREINTGIAAGKTKDWARVNRNPRNSEGFDLDYQEFQNGETWRQFYTRVSNCMENICEIDKSNLIIVTHGGTLAYIIAWWLKFTPEMLNTAYFSGSVGSISLLNNNSFKQNILQLFNDTSHLV